MRALYAIALTLMWVYIAAVRIAQNDALGAAVFAFLAGGYSVALWIAWDEERGA